MEPELAIHQLIEARANSMRGRAKDRDEALDFVVNLLSLHEKCHAELALSLDEAHRHEKLEREEMRLTLSHDIGCCIGILE